MSQLRKSGIEVLGDMPWGSHFCQYYSTRKDLLEILVPYFKAGLENNEFCFWVTCNPLTEENAIEAMREAIPDFDQFITEKRIEIVPHVNWYLKVGKFNPQDIIDGWRLKLEEALANGYDGMRVNGNESWLEEGDWDNFMKYEIELNSSMHDQQMIVLCTYPLSKTNAASILDVAHAHGRVIAKRKGRWEILEGPDIQELKADLKRKNYELEQKVAERTEVLSRTISELKNEIAERERVEEELKRSELRYRTLIEQASDAIIITDEHGLLIEVNTSFSKMVGYPEEELIGLDISTLIEPEHLKSVPLSFDLLLAGKALFRERLMKRKDGTVFHIEEHVKILSDKRILAILRDITERKIAEERLRINESQLSDAQQLAHIGSWNWDLQTGVVTWSDELYRIYGLEPQKSTIGPWTADFVDPRDRDLVNTTVNNSIKTKQPYSFHYSLVRPDGEKRIVHSSGRIITDEKGCAVKVLGTTQDVTEQKQVQDELNLAYQRLSYHVENTPLAVVEWDKDLFIKRWSIHAEEIFGWNGSEAIAKNLYDTDFHLIYKDDIQQVNRIAEQLMKGTVDRNVSLNRNCTKSGKVVYCEWYNSVLRDEHGNVITVLSLIHNVTERKEAEKTLLQSYEEIRQLTEHLQKIREEERIHIAREIHDELGQQLTAIKMDVAWIDKKTAEEATAIKTKLKNIIGLLDGSNLSLRRILSELRPRVLDDHGLLEAIGWLIRQFSETRDIPVKLTAPEKDIKVSEQIATSIFRVCQEALTNIARYSNAKNISISISIIEENIILNIEDDGIGFDAQSVQNKKSFGILGMRERVLSLGGKFELVSLPGKGTTITVSLPYTS